jgi:hypothetical protein
MAKGNRSRRLGRSAPLRRAVRWASLLSGMLLGAIGCAGIRAPGFRPSYVHHQEEAGTVQVGVQSVAPFEEYVDALQPKFKLDEKDAYSQAISQTQIESLRELRTLLAKIAVALPTTSKTVEQVLTRSNGQTSSSRTETDKQTPPTAPTVTAPATDATLAAVPSAPTDAVAIEASLQYRAAAALFQDVALLSSYVREAAVGQNTVPYIVRLLVTVLPSSRWSPYDAYTSVSFFLDEVTGKGKSAPYLASTEARFYDPAKPANWKELAGGTGCDGSEVQVIPLFVTDSFESTSLSTAREAVKGLGVSLSGGPANLTAGADLNAKNDSSQGTRSNDLNNIQTVAVTSNNTIQLRLGAASFEGGYRALPRTYNLTALILVPINPVPVDAVVNLFKQILHPNDPAGAVPILACDHVRFFAQASFREAGKGAVLPLAPRQALVTILETRLREEIAEAKDKNVSDAAMAAQRVDYKQFKSELGKLSAAASSRASALWPAMVSLVNSRGTSRGLVPLPQNIFHFFNLPAAGEGKAPILDDGKAAQVSLYGAERLTKNGLHGRLVFEYEETMIAMNSIDVAITPDGRGATITFPSVEAFLDRIKPAAAATGQTNLKSPPVPKTASLSLIYSPTSQRWSDGKKTVYSWKQDASPILLVKKPDPPKLDPGFALQAMAEFVSARRDGTGELAIDIRKQGVSPRTVLFRVSGAIVAKTEPDTSYTGGNGSATTDRAYVLFLKNLTGSHSITIHSWRLEGDTPVYGGDVVVPVVPGPDLPAGQEPSSGG